MKGRDHPTLGKALNAATNWRTEAALVDVDLAEINFRMSDSSPIRMRWEQETNPVTDANGVTTYELVWEGWVVTTDEF